MNRSAGTGRTKLAFMIDTIYGGGTETQFVMLLDHLSRERFDLHVVALRPTPWLEDYGARQSIPVRCFDLRHLKSLRTPGQLLALWRHLRAMRPDVAMTFFPTSNLVGVAVARAAGARRVYSTRRDFGLWPDCVFRGDLRLLRLVNRLLDGIVVNAAVVKDLVLHLEGYDPARIHVIYNGVEPRHRADAGASAAATRSRLGIPPGAPVVGIVAGLRPMKRHQTFIDAARRILDRHPEAHFLLVGDGPLRDVLESRTRDLGMRENFHFCGWQNDVIPFLEVMDIGVNCSANEGLSNAVMEYMATGLPCVVSDAGGNPELVENGVNGLVFRLDDAAGLAGRVLGLLDDRAARERLAARSRQVIEGRFSVQAMIGAYERLLTSPGGGR